MALRHRKILTNLLNDALDVVFQLCRYGNDWCILSDRALHKQFDLIEVSFGSLFIKKGMNFKYLLILENDVHLVLHDDDVGQLHDDQGH